MRALGLTADLLELLEENEFKVTAYRRAERLLDRWDGNWAAAVQARFKGVPGVGAQLGAALAEMDSTGEFGPLEEAAALVPPGVLGLLAVRGLGPKKARALWNAGVDSIEGLVEAGREGRLASLKGFGAATQAKLLEAADFALRSRTRHLASAGVGVRELVAAQLEGIAEVELAGGARRGMETLGDVDLVALGDRAATRSALDALGAREDPERPWAVRLNLDGIEVEVATAEPDSYGAALALMTGPGGLSRRLVARAEEKGLGLTSRGLYDGYELIPTPTEADLFHALGLDLIIPEWREAEHETLPPGALPDPGELVRSGDLRGMLHVHTTWSDGVDSLERMALGARELGMTHVGVCDHSQLAAYAGGLSPERVRQQWREVDALNASLEGIRVLKGIECDIHADGRLDYDDELLAGFDFVVASVHSSFGLSEADQTARIVRAVSHPAVTILGHPTGRLLLRRDGYRLDLGAVLDAAEAHGTAVEINASPYRLDLDWRHALAARGRNLRWAIDTDAHRADGMHDLRYGVAAARKAGLTRAQVVNAMSADEFLAFARAKAVPA